MGMRISSCMERSFFDLRFSTTVWLMQVALWLYEGLDERPSTSGLRQVFVKKVQQALDSKRNGDIDGADSRHTHVGMHSNVVSSFLETSSALPSISAGIILLPSLRCFLLQTNSHQPIGKRANSHVTTNGLLHKLALQLRLHCRGTWGESQALHGLIPGVLWCYLVQLCIPLSPACFWRSLTLLAIMLYVQIEKVHCGLAWLQYQCELGFWQQQPILQESSIFR